jgi:CARDB protein
VFRSVVILATLLSAVSAFAGPNLSITESPYLTGGLFTAPVLPQEGQEVTITVRAEATEPVAEGPLATVEIHRAQGRALVSKTLTLQPIAAPAGLPQAAGEAKPTYYQAQFTWKTERNGLHTVRVRLDPTNAIKEADENDNAAELLLPVIVAGRGRALHFPWYREDPAARWTTCVTSANDVGQRARLSERGVTGLHWAPATINYTKDEAKANPEAVLTQIEQTLFERYTAEGAPEGCGIDEVGGYPDTFRLKGSIAAMRGLIRAREAKPDRFYVVWNCGGLRPQLGAVCRQAADLYVLETYLWRALPEEIGAQDIYAYLAGRDTFVRATDMYQPAYGNACYTLLGLDNTERPDRTNLGELENVIRFIRRRMPEMRGLAWYNGSTRMEKTDENSEKMAAVLSASDDLCFKYWIKPCVTLMNESLWLTEGGDDALELTAAVSNIGSIDSERVDVEFFVDGKSVGRRSTASVPAGPGRYDTMAQLTLPLAPKPGPHAFKARIVYAPNATVLDTSLEIERFVN